MATAQIQDSEYGSLGRQDQEHRFYQHVRRSATGSEEISEDHQVAEEDMGSFIKHRNAYLDDEIQTESQLFKVSFIISFLMIWLATTKTWERSKA